MKILHVIASMDPRAGGPCQGIRNLVPPAREQHHSVEVVCLDDPRSEYLAHENITIHALGKGRTAWSYHPALRPWLEANLPRFDAVILNGLWQYPGYLMSRLAQRPNTPPYFVFPHGMLDPWFQRAPERRWKAIRNWLLWKMIEHRVIQNARAVLFTCAEELRLARDTFRPYKPRREINVGYGVTPPPEFNERMTDVLAQKCPGLKNFPYFIFLGRIHSKKGMDILIKAYANIYHPPNKVRSQKSVAGHRTPALVLAGPGVETEYGRQMQKLAADLCSPASVFWPGMLTGDSKWAALYHAEAFALTSHQENFGIAVVEALACGKPVLISNQINIWREIDQDKAGLVGEDNLTGVEEIFQQWENLSPEKRSAMKRSARCCYENHFGIARATRNLLATVEELIACPQVPEFF